MLGHFLETTWDLALWAVSLTAPVICKRESFNMNIFLIKSENWFLDFDVGSWSSLIRFLRPQKVWSSKKKIIGGLDGFWV